MAFAQTSTAERVKAAVGTVALEALIFAGLIAGVRGHPQQLVDDAVKVFQVPPPAEPPRPPPPPPSVEPVPRTKDPEGAASPPNLRSKATEVVAPKPVIPPPVPPIAAAPKPDIGSQTSSGAAEVPGPGTGSGGTGEGTGSGLGGSGSGGGGRAATPPRHISGRLRDSDYPSAARDAGIEGSLTVVVTIEPSGRVSNCDVVRSSGSPLLDTTTCRLIQQRYRYRPARDVEGRPVRSREMQNHSWVMAFERPDAYRR